MPSTDIMSPSWHAGHRDDGSLLAVFVSKRIERLAWGPLCIRKPPLVPSERLSLLRRLDDVSRGMLGRPSSSG